MPVIAQQNGSLMHDGLTRSYIYYMPQSDEPLPLLIAMHGYTQTASSIMGFSDFNQLAEEENFMVVYPQGIGNSWNVDFGGGSTADDVGFINALIDELSSNFPVDENRFYATGFSNGGFMSYRLAYELPEKIAAIAAVAGTSDGGIGIVNQDISASQEIWNFVKNFSSNDWVVTPENHNETISVYPNPLKANFIFIENLPKNSRSIAVYDALGKLILKKTQRILSNFCAFI